jgi:hypothetical protein
VADRSCFVGLSSQRPIKISSPKAMARDTYDRAGMPDNSLDCGGRCPRPEWPRSRGMSMAITAKSLWDVGKQVSGRYDYVNLRSINSVYKYTLFRHCSSSSEAFHTVRQISQWSVNLALLDYSTSESIFCSVLSMRYQAIAQYIHVQTLVGGLSYTANNAGNVCQYLECVG